MSGVTFLTEVFVSNVYIYNFVFSVMLIFLIEGIIYSIPLCDQVKYC